MSIVSPDEFPDGLRCATCDKPILVGEEYRSVPFVDDTTIIVCPECAWPT